MFKKIPNPENEELVICKSILGGNTYGCGWTGKLSEANKIDYSNEGKTWISLTGKQRGHYYTCPKCGLTIKQELE